MLTGGTKLGPYEILAPLGAGGMGEVYRARDTRLGREVALKVLPASLSGDPERLRRFEQEARAAGALNHPNVLAVFDVGSYDGAPFLVTELLEGETLFERLRPGPLPVRKAIDVVAQAAQGVAAAHDKGIIHRDLKPANIFLTADARVKVLDFGLAKLGEREDASLSDAQVPTLTAAGATEPGVVLGTVGYMSPEQVRGKPADARSDVFALGAVLYETLSGQRAFQRDSSVEAMAAILKEEPPPVSGINQNVSPGLERVVGHCLEKDPHARFQSARDLAFALEAVSGVSGLSAVHRAFEPALAAAPRRRRLLFAAIGTLGLVIAAVAGYFFGRGIATRPPVSYERLTFRPGDIISARFGPDGQTILYAAQWQGAPSQVFSTRPGSPESRSFDLPPSTNLLSVSSSGEIALLLHAEGAIAFQSVGTLAEASLAGGAPREILKDVAEADWSPDAAQLAVLRRRGGKETLEFPPGNVLYRTDTWIADLRISPDGRHIAFVDHPAIGDDGGTIAIVDLAGRKRMLTGSWSSARGLAWSPSGDAIWFTASSRSNRALYSVSLSGRQRLISAVPGSMNLFDVSRDGRALVKQADERIEMAVLPPGSAERSLTWLDWSLLADLSADGKTVLFTEGGEGGGSDYSVYVRKLDGSPAVRLGEGQADTLSPDGQWVIATHEHVGGATQLYLLPTGAGEPRQLTTGNFDHRLPAWLPDSKAILFTGFQAGRQPHVFLQPLDGPAKPITPDGFYCWNHSVSPDGKSFLAYRASDNRGVIFPITGGEARPIPGMNSQEFLMQWAPDVKSIVVYQYGTSESPGMKISRIDLATGKQTLVKDLLPADQAGVTSMARAVLAPDGETIVFSYVRVISNLYLVHGAR